MKGEFGPLYNRIDGQVFFEWIRKFMGKRQAISERINLEKQSNNNIYEMFQHPQVQEAIQTAADKLKIEEAPAQEAKRTSPSRFEQMLMDEYDALPTWDDNIRFSVYKNKPYMFTEYRKERYRELIEQQNEYWCSTQISKVLSTMCILNAQRVIAEDFNGRTTARIN